MLSPEFISRIKVRARFSLKIRLRASWVRVFQGLFGAWGWVEEKFFGEDSLQRARLGDFKILVYDHLLELGGKEIRLEVDFKCL